jgi:hypothetical protein
VEACYRHRWMVSCGITVGAGATGLVGVLTCAGTARKQTRPAPGSLREPIPPLREWRGPPSRSQSRSEVRPHFPPAGGQLHLHFHDLDAEDVAAILNRQDAP